MGHYVIVGVLVWFLISMGKLIALESTGTHLLIRWRERSRAGGKTSHEQRFLHVLTALEWRYIIGEAVRTKMYSSNRENPIYEYDLPRVVLTQGSRGEEVRTWQIATCSHVDSIFGPRTETETEVWQEMMGLPGTGIVDEVCWAMLEVMMSTGTAPALQYSIHSQIASQKRAELRTANEQRQKYEEYRAKTPVLAKWWKEDELPCAPQSLYRGEPVRVIEMAHGEYDLVANNDGEVVAHLPREPCTCSMCGGPSLSREKLEYIKAMSGTTSRGPG